MYLPNVWSSHCGFNLEREYVGLPFDKGEIFTFGSLNNFRKISDETLNTWSVILNNVSNSRLILKSSTFCDSTLLIEKFKKNGVKNKIEILNLVLY